MGGKHKQAQRTKNNARPSSSGRSAELLGNQAPKFVGFGAAKDGGYVPVLPGFSLGGSDVLDPNISADFQIVLKKMNKKDATTKLKALQEFAELVGGSEEREVCSVLPFWPRLYGHLAVDVEHRVREAAHLAQRAVVRSARRNLAPYLRQLVGPWFTSQYDTYSPAASAAAQSFQEAFPPNKVPEVIVFCQNEILNYIHDNIIVQKPQTVGNPQAMSKEELEAKYERLLVGSLQGYALYLDAVPPDRLDAARDSNKRITSSKKFWKYNRHPSSLVRSAWFKVVVALCQKTPDLVSEESAQATLAVFNNLDEADPVVLSAVWDAALHAVTTLQDCWAHVSAEKLVLPKLWHVLRQGGQGSAAAIFPNLLPLLSRLPDAATRERSFFPLFFTHMRQGFSQKCVYQSISESNAVARCYAECLRFVLVKHFEKQDLCFDLIENHLVPAVELALRSDSRTLAAAVFRHVAALAGSWDGDERLAELRGAFWAAAGGSVLRLLKDRDPPPPGLLDHVSLLCSCLGDSSHDRPRPQHRVKFAGEGEGAVCDDPAPVPRLTPGVHLKGLVRDVCRACLEGIAGGGLPLFLPLLATLLRRFGDEGLLAALAGDRPPLAWAEATVCGWLRPGCPCPREVVVFAFVLLEMLPETQRRPLLEHLSQLARDGSLLVWFLEAAVLHRHVPAVGEWLSGAGCRPLLVCLAGHSLGGPLSREAQGVVRDLLKETPQAGLLLPMEAVETVLRVYLEALSAPWEALAHTSCVSLACELVASLHRCDLAVTFQLLRSPVCRDLVVLLFDASCRLDAPYRGLHPEAVGAWSAAVGAVSRARGSGSDDLRDLLEKFAVVLRRKLLEPLDPDDAAVHHLSLAVARSLLVCAARDPTGRVDHAVLATLHARLLDAVSRDAPGWRAQAADLCLYALSAAGTLHCPGAYPGVAPLPAPSEVPCFSRLVALGLFSALLLSELRRPAGDDDEEPATFRCLREHVVSVVYTLVLGTTFSFHYKSTSYASAISTKLAALSTHAQKLLDDLSSGELAELAASIYSRSRVDGGLWLLVNDLPLSASLDLTCCERLEENETPHPHAIQLYWSLKPSSEIENPAPVEDVLRAPDVGDPTLAVAAAWCRGGSFAGERDFWERCAAHARDQLRREALLWSEGRDAAVLSWEEVSRTVCVLNFTTAVLSKDGTEASSGLASDGQALLPPVLQALTECRPLLLVPPAGLRAPLSRSRVEPAATGSPDDCKAQVVAVAALRLLSQLRSGRQPDASWSWESRYTGDVCASLLQLLLFVSERAEVHTLTCHDVPLLESLVSAVTSFETEELFSGWGIEKIAEFGCDLLTKTVSELQQVGYHVLKSLLKHLVSTDSKTLERCIADSGDEAEMVAGLSVWRLLPVLDHTQGLMEALLSDFSLGDCCLVRPHTDSFAFARAYLLAWDLLLAACAHADADLRFHYASHLSDQGYVASLLQILFRLMPEDVVHLKKCKNMEFLQSALPSGGIELLGSSLTSECLQDWVCWVYLRALQRLPAVVRQWWSGLDSRASSLVEQVTAQYLSPTLCGLEMESLQPKNGNMTVHVYGRAREVVAKYHVEDVSLELSVVLPSNHPLGPVKVESVTRQPMVEYANWRNWIMQLTVFLAHQNGSLWDGLNLWKSNLDKRFEGIEECYICFSILHGSSFQIPKIRCDTCKKKFHSHCMYKWFDTSNKSTCPICRNFIL